MTRSLGSFFLLRKDVLKDLVLDLVEEEDVVEEEDMVEERVVAEAEDVLVVEGGGSKEEEICAASAAVEAASANSSVASCDSSSLRLVRFPPSPIPSAASLATAASSRGVGERASIGTGACGGAWIAFAAAASARCTPRVSLIFFLRSMSLCDPIKLAHWLQRHFSPQKTPAS